MHAVGCPVLEVGFGHTKIAPEAGVATASNPHARGVATTACIVVHNGTNIIGRCLDALIDGAALSHVIVVDDASSDGTSELVRVRYPAVELIGLARNGGPAAARNAAFAAARTQRVLFVDADVAVSAGCVQALHEALDAEPAAVMAMPRVLDAIDPQRVHYDGAAAHFLGLMQLESRGARDGGASPARSTGSVVTSCVLVDAQRWGSAEPFDGALAHTYEDHDLGIRARLRGWDILSVPAARCLHGSGTPGLSVRDGDKATPLRMHLLFRNRWRIMLKTYRVRTFLVLAPALFCFELALLAAALRKGWVRQWAGALCWNMARLPDTLRTRRAWQRQRRRSDAELLCAGPLPVRPGVAATPVQRAALLTLQSVMDGYWKMAGRLL
jgi:GT2 family glycosyltransferase